MRMYFLRHADAVEGGDDAARPLSPRGREEVKIVGRFLRDAGVRFDAVFSSPLTRARQTAEVVLELCGGSAKLEFAEALLNESSSDGFSRWLGQLPAVEHVLLVGHAPTLALRVRELLGIANSEALKMPTGGLACLESNDRKTGSLKFLVAPELLRPS